MMKMKDKNSFNYTYSAPQQEEIAKIREKYVTKDSADNKMEQLRRLDKSAEKPGTVAAIALGLISTALFALGLYFSIDGSDSQFVLGVIIGIIGIVGMIFAMPLNNFITKKKRAQIAPEILKLTDELSEKENK